MKFFSPTDEPIHVSLTSGHTAVVTAEGTELTEMFQREAVARGAILKDGDAAGDLRAQQLTRTLTIREALIAARDGNSQDAFKQDGTPDLRKLIGKLGFPVAREEADALWAEITKAV
jgi:hypothetical protein